MSAAATGAIAGAASALATRSLVDVSTAVVAVLVFLVLVRWKVSELWLIGTAGIWGLMVA